MITKPKTFSVGDMLRRSQLIDLDPDFQRGKVWSLSKQQYFIDTILKGWGIPKIYLAKGGGPSEENYVCIDGKQRLTAIFAFVQDGFSLGHQKYTEKSFQNKFYTELPKKVQDAIDRYKITTEIISGATEGELGELFKRLQHGLQLNSSEKLKASNSKMAHFVSYVSKGSFFKRTVLLKDTRGAYFAIASQLCCLGVSGQIVNLKYKDLEKFFNDYQNFNNKNSQAKHVKVVLEYMIKMFDKRTVIFSNRANIISVFVLISELMRRSDVSGKGKKLGKFFEKFFSSLKNVKNTNNINDRDDYFKYQNATIQAADTKRSIIIRHEILLKRLANYSNEFKKIINVTTKEEEFKKLYDKFEKKHGGNSGDFNTYLKSKYPSSIIQCGKYLESIPIHVRHSIHHKQHPKYTKLQLLKALNVLGKL